MIWGNEYVAIESAMKPSVSEKNASEQGHLPAQSHTQHWRCELPSCHICCIRNPICNIVPSRPRPQVRRNRVHIFVTPSAGFSKGASFSTQLPFGKVKVGRNCHCVDQRRKQRFICKSDRTNAICVRMLMSVTIRWRLLLPDTTLGPLGRGTVRHLHMTSFYMIPFV